MKLHPFLIFATACLACAASAQLSPSWVKRYVNDTTPARGSWTHVTTDSAGNIYTVGFCNQGPATNEDLMVAKYTNSGVAVFEQRIVLGSATVESPRGIAFDNSRGILYVTCQSATGITTLALPESGTWIQRDYSGTSGTASHEPQGIQLDLGGNVFVFGSSNNGGPTGTNAFVIKYAPGLASVAWSQLSDGFTRTDSWSDAAVGADGSITLCGTTSRSDTNNDVVVRQYAAGGSINWTNVYGHASNGHDSGTAIVRSSAGNYYVSGTTDRGGTTGSDFLVIKYTATGERPWVIAHGSAGADSAVDIAVEADSPVVVGTLGQASIDIGVLRLQGDSGLDWFQVIANPAGRSDAPGSVLFDPQGHVSVAGRVQESSSFDDTALLVARLDGENGDEMWRYKTGSYSASNQHVLDIHGNVVAAGHSLVASSGLGLQPSVWKFYQALVATPDGYNVTENRTFNVPASGGLLSNDFFYQNSRIVITTPVNRGSLSVNASTGAFTYTPESGYIGGAFFRYKLVRGTQETPTVEVFFSVRHWIMSVTAGTPDIVGGNSTRISVGMSGPARTAGDNLQVEYFGGSEVSGPASLFIPEGSSSGSFIVNTIPVTATTVRTVRVSGTANALAVNITIRPATLSRLTVTPSTVVGGNTANGVVFLTGRAAMAKTVTLSDNSSAVSVPASATVAAGNASAAFTVNTSRVSATATRQITGVLEGITRSVNITLTPP